MLDRLAAKLLIDLFERIQNFIIFEVAQGLVFYVAVYVCR
jgi:hypothetical protein